MKNWINKMSKEKAQRVLFITVLILVFGVFFISLSFIEPTEQDPIDQPNDDIEDPIDDPNENVPEFETIAAPYKDETLQTVRKYWSLEKSTEDQEMSFILMGSTYYKSNGVSYTKEDGQEFDVVASLSGTVLEVTESDIYGKTVVLQHDNDIVTEYVSLGTVNVEVGDEVTQGDVIGTSGVNEFDATVGSHVHFRINIDDRYYDPEFLIGKKVNQITTD